MQYLLLSICFLLLIIIQKKTTIRELLNIQLFSYIPFLAIYYADINKAIYPLL